MIRPRFRKFWMPRPDPIGAPRPLRRDQRIETRSRRGQRCAAEVLEPLTRRAPLGPGGIELGAQLAQVVGALLARAFRESQLRLE
jgi:hypothetical protein